PVISTLSLHDALPICPGEINAEHYHFLSAADFGARIEAGHFLEHAKLHEDLYGTLREPVVTNLENGTDVLIDIDTQGAATIRNSDRKSTRLNSSHVSI